MKLKPYLRHFLFWIWMNSNFRNGRRKSSNLSFSLINWSSHIRRNGTKRNIFPQNSLNSFWRSLCFKYSNYFCEIWYSIPWQNMFTLLLCLLPIWRPLFAIFSIISNIILVSTVSYVSWGYFPELKKNSSTVTIWNDSVIVCGAHRRNGRYIYPL